MFKKLPAFKTVSNSPNATAFTFESPASFHLLQEGHKMAEQGYTVDFADMIGHGGFGFVYKATNRVGVASVAKVINCRNMSKREMQEVQNCYKLQLEHPHIIKVFDVIQDQDHTYIFMEYCEYGNLRTFFAKRDFTTREKVELMAQIANGIAYLA